MEDASKETTDGGKKGTIDELKSNPTKMLGLGLVLLLGTFAIKLLLFDVAGTNFPTYFSVPKLMAQRKADLAEYEYEVDKLQRRIGKLTRESFKADVKGQESIRKQVEELEKKRDSLQEKNREAIEKISERYDEKLFNARRKLVKASASGLSWLQMGIWMKILLDIPKIAGCLLIVFSTFQLVVDPKAPGHLKSFAIVCSTIVLLMATAWSFLGLVS